MELICGDSFEILKSYPDNYFDSCITDPPYGLTSITKRFGKETSAPAKEGTDGRFSRLSKGFLGKEWDGTGIEKNPEFWKEVYRVLKPGAHLLAFGGTRTSHRIFSAIEDAGFEIRDSIYWVYGQGFPKSHNIGDGWGTSLKPAIEPICLARKPISEKNIALNVLRWGTGGINIDESRIELNGEVVPVNKLESWSGFGQEVRPDYEQELNTKGRWPSNLILDEDASKLLDEQKEGASRFFYCAKPSKKEKLYSNHPTVKPVKLMEYLVRLVTPKGGIVLDPFVGSGTTIVACKNLGFNGIGIDLDNEQIEFGKRRLNMYIGPDDDDAESESTSDGDYGGGC